LSINGCSWESRYGASRARRELARRADESRRQWAITYCHEPDRAMALISSYMWNSYRRDFTLVLFAVELARLSVSQEGCEKQLKQVTDRMFWPRETSRRH
jgi:hypothetical protein